MMMPRTIAWVDGVNSAVMAHMALLDDPEIVVAHCDLGASVHEDSHRFINDLEQWYGKEIIRLKSPKYGTIDDVFEDRGYLSGINGAPCTGAMKFAPRMDFELPSDTHLWGYTADKADAARFHRMQESYPFLKQRSPLVEMGLKKQDTHAILRQHGVKRPYVYEIGFPNGNCIGCVKATSPNYWALIRKHFPEVFARRADQSRRFGKDGVRLTRVKGERVFIDEIPADWPTTMRGQKWGGCGFHCATEDMV
jgi:hypothetical protein